MRLAHAGVRDVKPRQSRNGNHIWLVTCVITVIVVVFVAVRLSGGGCAARPHADGAAAAGGAGGPAAAAGGGGGGRPAGGGAPPRPVGGGGGQAAGGGGPRRCRGRWCCGSPRPPARAPWPCRSSTTATGCRRSRSAGRAAGGSAWPRAPMATGAGRCVPPGRAPVGRRA